LHSRLEDAVSDITKRLAAMESGMGPADGTAVKEYAAELKQHSDKTRFLEEQVENLRQQLVQRLSTQEDLTTMRLETIERELLSTVRPADLDSLRSEIEETRKSLQQDIPERMRVMGLELQGDLQSRATNLEKDLKVVSDNMDGKLQIVEEQLEAIASAGTGSGSGSGDGGASSAQIAIATGKLSKEIADLGARVAVMEPLSDQNLEGRIRELEQFVSAERVNMQVGNIDIDSKRLLGEELEKGETSPTSPTGGKEFGELATRVDGALDGMAKRLLDLEQQVSEKVTGETAPASPTVAPAVTELPKAPDLPQLAELAKHVDTSLEEMARRIIALEEGGFGSAPGSPLSAEETKRLVAEAAAEATAPPSTVLTEFSNRMDESLSDVAKRMGNLEKQLGAIQEQSVDIGGALVEAGVGPEPEGGSENEGILGELAKRVDAQLDGLQRKIGALEQVAEQQRRPASASASADVVQRLAEVERQLAELPSAGGVAPNMGVSPNILEGLQHEMESAKARIELQLGQDLEAKTAALEQRLSEKIVAASAGSGASSEATQAIEVRMVDVEAALEALKGAAAEAPAPVVQSRDLVFDTNDGQPPVLMEDFNALSDQVGAMEQKITQAVISAAEGAAINATNAAAADKAEGQRQMESRMTSMWTELAGHAEVAAVRADALERSLMSRIEKIESSIVNIMQNGFSNSQQSKKDDEVNLKKSLEWINWRISWLEWATNGEKRSFARSVDHRGVLGSAPSQTNTATCFGQPITEDVELWARDPKTGKQRLRRELRADPQSFREVTNGPNGPVIGPLGKSASLGRLPRL